MIATKPKRQKPGRKRMGDEAQKRRGTHRPDRSDAAAENPSARKPGSPALRLVPDRYPRIGQKTIEKAIKCLPNYDPYEDAGECTFDWKAAKKRIDFIHHRISHVKGDLARQPFLLEQWEIGIVANIYGWKNPDGTRRFTEAFIFIPRKNGKTPLCAALIVAEMAEGGERGAELYGAGATHEQGCHVFAHARGMVLQDAQLTERFHVLNGQSKAIEERDTFSIYKVIASDADTQHGQNANFATADELHAWKKGSELLDVLETAMAGRRQPLLISATTSDYERPGSLCNEKYDYAVKIRDGIIKERSFLPVIYEASKDDDWTDPKVWAKANPNLGVSVNRRYMEKKCRKAQDSPAFENIFKRLHLNIRTEQNVRWIPMELWDACAGEIDLEALRGVPCYGGLDLSSTADITAFVLLFVHEGRIVLVPHFWVPERASTDREAKARKSYDGWVRDGLMWTTPDNMIDYARVRRDINALAETYSIQGIAVDRLFQGAQLANELQQDGFDVVSHGQGMLSMASPTLSFETHLKGGKLLHDGNAVLRWMASNAAVEIDAAGNMKPTKAESFGKIDGIVTSVMALSLQESTPASTGYSREVLVG